jgi:hypothetical protein
MSLKRAAAKALAEHFAREVSMLAGKTHSVSAEPEEATTTPALYVLPGKMTYESVQAVAVDETFSLLTAGYWVGTWELRLCHRTPHEREALEQAVLACFYRIEGAPGTLDLLLVPVLDGTPAQTPVLCVFRIYNAEWNEEKSFDKKRFAYLDMDVELPHLMAGSELSFQVANVPAVELDASDPDDAYALVIG